MLPKSQRLTTGDFKKLRTRKAIHTPHFLLRLNDTPSHSNKAAVIVSSAVYKRAVDRNLLRRRIYHTLRTRPSLILHKAVTVTVKKGALSIPYKEVEKEIREALTPRNVYGKAA